MNEQDLAQFVLLSAATAHVRGVPLSEVQLAPAEGMAPYEASKFRLTFFYASRNLYGIMKAATPEQLQETIDAARASLADAGIVVPAEFLH